MHTCWHGTCVEIATREYKGNYFCNQHYNTVLKDAAVNRLRTNNSTLQAIAVRPAVDVEKNRNDISIEFCIWLQDTDVFSAFTDHLNKGLRLEDLDINSVQMAEAKMKKAGA